MNEALLIILILITGITFFNLVKKIGLSTPVPPSPLHKNGLLNFPESFGNVIYSGNNNDVNNVYNNLWSITATTCIDNNPVLDKITVVYHQCKKATNILNYAETNTGNNLFNTDVVFIPADVCVSSNISDVQYRHVLRDM